MVVILSVPDGSVIEEAHCFWNELRVVLEDAAVSGIGVDRQPAVRQSTSQVPRVGGGHHSVMVAVRHEHRLLDARQVARLLPAPAVDGLEVRSERSDGDGLVPVVGALPDPRR